MPLLYYYSISKARIYLIGDADNSINERYAVRKSDKMLDK